MQSDQRSYNDLKSYEDRVNGSSFRTCAHREINSAGETWYQVFDLSRNEVKAIAYSEKDAEFIWAAPMIITGLIAQLRATQAAVTELQDAFNLSRTRFPVQGSFDPVTCETMPAGSIDWATGLAVVLKARSKGSKESLAEAVARGFTYSELDLLQPGWRVNFEVSR